MQYRRRGPRVNIPAHRTICWSCGDNDVFPTLISIASRTIKMGWALCGPLAQLSRRLSTGQVFSNAVALCWYQTDDCYFQYADARRLILTQWVSPTNQSSRYY